MEKIIETKKCKNCGAKFDITDKDLEFYDKVSPTFNGKKYNIPTPKLCPDCRTQQRMIFRNFFSLYNRKCDLTGKNILATYDDNVEFPVYEMNEWRSDKWDAFEYGFDINLNQDIFEQIQKLHKTVPRMNIMNINCENTKYCNMSANSKNCYLIGGNIFNEDCCYGHIVWYSKNCFDCLYIYECELCYECVDCLESYKVHFGINVENCSESMFLINCTGCRNCFGCSGLNNKQYYIFNKKYPKDEYIAKINKLKPKSQEDINKIWNRVENIDGKKIVKCFHGYNCENVSGNYIYFSKNVHNCYDIKKSENLKYCTTLDHFTNSYDCNYSGTGCDLSYNCMSTYGYHNMFCHNCLSESSNMLYSDNCYYSNNCFGCVGLKNQEYCIFNKQYTKKEYEKLVPKIIEKMIKNNQWGEFLPKELSSYGYNESIVSEYFPLKKENAIKNGFKRKDKNEKNSIGKMYKIQNIEYYNDEEKKKEILSGVIQCKETNKNFRIISKELDFYIKMEIPIPNKHPNIRHQNRMRLRNPRKLFDMNCDKCGIDIKTTYSPDRKESVYCQFCYNQEI